MLPPLPALPPLCFVEGGRCEGTDEEIGGGGVLMLLLLLLRGVAEASWRGGGELLLRAPPATTCGTLTIVVRFQIGSNRLNWWPQPM